MIQPQDIQINTIIEDIELQMREDIDFDHVDSLKEHLDELPPIELYEDSTTGKYYIGDGWHRFLAHKLEKKKTIRAIIHLGGRKAAILRAIGANAEHNALRRTNRDKRKAVIFALKSYSTIFSDSKISAREIARACRVTHPFVLKIQKEVVTVTTSKNKESDKGVVTVTTQIDFFADLDETYRVNSEALHATLNHTYFLCETIPNAEKIKTLEAMEYEADRHKQAIRDLKTKLKAQQEAA